MNNIYKHTSQFVHDNAQGIQVQIQMILTLLKIKIATDTSSTQKRNCFRWNNNRNQSQLICYWSLEDLIHMYYFFYKSTFLIIKRCNFVSFLKHCNMQLVFTSIISVTIQVNREQKFPPFLENLYAVVKIVVHIFITAYF